MHALQVSKAAVIYSRWLENLWYTHVLRQQHVMHLQLEHTTRQAASTDATSSTATITAI
jgi:hypothetical protein